MVADEAGRLSKASTRQKQQRQEHQQFHNAKPKTSKRRLVRQLLKPVSAPWQGKGTGDKLDALRQSSLDRPRTAPSTSTDVQMGVSPVPPLPSLPFERSSVQHERKAPPRLPHTESGVVRDVNAWLDANTKPALPLMSGLPYWREGSSLAGAGPLLQGQYAEPIFHESSAGRDATSPGRPLKSFCRRAKKMQVRMPSLKHLRSQQAALPKHIYRRSASTPQLSAFYKATARGSGSDMSSNGPAGNPMFRPSTASATRPAPFGGWGGMGPGPMSPLPLRPNTSSSASTTGAECLVERREDTKRGIRPMASTSLTPREDSVGSLQLSEAPTYFTGPPPPSYRSRAASILSTSSFGCIDGMNPEQRQLSQQRAQERRGVKGKLKKIARKALFTK